MWVVAGAANPEKALAFIDYQLRPEVAAREAAYTRYATQNASAFKRLDQKLQADPATYPTAEVIGRLEYGMPLTPEGVERRAELWAELRGQPSR